MAPASNLSSDDQVIDLCARFWEWRLEDLPAFASFKGFHAYSHQLDDRSEEAYAARKIATEQFLLEATNIDIDACNKENVYNLRVLRHALDTYVRGIEFGGHHNAVDGWNGIDKDLTRATSKSPFDTVQDYRNCIKRLKAFPHQVDAAIDILNIGLQKGILHPQHAFELAVSRISEAIEKGPETSDICKPFRNIPEHFTEHERKELQQAGLEAHESTKNALIQLRDHLYRNILPHAREDLAISSMPNGKAKYTASIRYHCDESIDPEVIHILGLKEVEKTKSKIKELMEHAGIQGSMHDYRKYLCRDKSMFCSTKEELLDYYQHLLDNKIRPKLKDYFDYIPEIKLKLVADTNMPAPAMYYGPPADGKQPANLIVCCDNLQDRPKYETTALALHEGEPGHHFQACYVIEKLRLPEFRIYKDDRKYGETPSAFPMYCAYTEGWALYCEELGIEMGVYDDDASLFGYYCSNIARACRLVVDTGIHAMGWNYDRALSYMLENSGLSEARSRTEIRRYAVSAAQGLSYKIGHFKFQQLRRKAETELGAKFDIKGFHRACIQCGQVPLQILEQSIQDYIDNINGKWGSK